MTTDAIIYMDIYFKQMLRCVNHMYHPVIYHFAIQPLRATYGVNSGTQTDVL